MDNTYNEFFFPAFTLRLLKELGDGRSINLIGRREQGAGRVLDELQKAAPESVLVLRVNLHDFRYSYTGLIDALWRQALEVKAVPTQRNPPNSLAKLCDRVKVDDYNQIWLLLERFDTLMDVDHSERDPRYNCDFFKNELNSLRNRPRFLMLSQTAHPHAKYSVICGENLPPLSPPDLQKEVLPALGESEIRAELQRFLQKLPAMVVTRVAEQVLRHQRLYGSLGIDNPYELLEQIIRKLEQGFNTGPNLEQDLKRWTRAYENPLAKANLGNLNRLRRWFKLRLRLLGFTVLDLLKELSLIHKVIDTWHKFRRR